MKRTTTRRLVLIAAGPAALAGLLLTSGTAFASTGPAGNGQTGHLTGKSAVSYTDPWFGPVRCNETQHPTFDTVSCQSTTGAPVTNASPGQVISFPGQWNSDFAGGPAGGSITVTVNADGMGYTGQATYPAAG
jgi:hypothetical protein